MSYLSLVSEFEQVFTKPEWTKNGIQAYPSNFSPTDERPMEYIVLEVLPNSPLMNQFGGERQVAGLFIAQIYIPAEKGSRRVFEISDFLDDVLHTQMLQYTIQTASSSLAIKGNDSQNPALFRADYSVSFNSY